MTDPRARHAELAALINDARFQYYVLDNPTLTDAGFDAMMAELTAIEEALPELRTPDSPSQQVGGAAFEQFVREDFALAVLEGKAWQEGAVDKPLSKAGTPPHQTGNTSTRCSAQVMSAWALSKSGSSGWICL